MKKITEIENMDWEALEKAAESRPAKVPEDLEAGIKAAILASETARPKATPRRLPVAAFYGFAFAATITALVVVGVNRINSPRDTFDDPYLAYAEVQKTFRQISDKMNPGLELASEAREAAEKPAEILKKINK